MGENIRYIMHKYDILSIKMFMVLCTLFIHINIIPTRQKIHLIWTEYYSEQNVYVFALAGARTPIAWVRVHHANHYTTKASQLTGVKILTYWLRACSEWEFGTMDMVEFPG